MNIGFYGATGSNDFGDFAMMICNINNILQNKPDSLIHIYTPDKYNTLRNLIYNIDKETIKNNIKIVEEPNLFGSSILSKAIEKICCRLNVSALINYRFGLVKKNNYKYLNREFLCSVSKLDVLIFNGGGYLQEAWKYKNVNFVLACLLAKQKDIPVYFLGNSVGPLDAFEQLVMESISNIDGILVRDGYNYTAKLLDSYECKNYIVASDDLLFVNDIYNCPQKYDNYVIIELMFYIMRAKKGSEWIIEELIKFIDYVSDTKNVLLVTFDEEDYNAKTWINQIKNRVKRKDRVICCHDVVDIYEMFGYYKYADFSISFKYHPLILSLGSNVPCIGIICDSNGYYEGKMKGAFDSCGIDYKNKVIHLDEVSYKKLVELYELNSNKNLYTINERDRLKTIYYDYLKKCLR